MFQSATATVYPLPSKSHDVVGRIYRVHSRVGDTFTTLGQRYDVGYYELLEANPKIDPEHIPSQTLITIPAQYILPPAERQGIVINLSELRLFYYPKDEKIVVTEPVGIGRIGWETPKGKTKIVKKQRHPTWYSPKSVREWRAKQGVILPKVVPPGPDNPLGDYALRLSWPAYLIHGTNDPSGVGRRVTAGCVRMYPDDIALLFDRVESGTVVHIIDEPYKIGWQNDQLYLEAHVPLEEKKKFVKRDFSDFLRQLKRGKQPVNLKIARAVLRKASGIPRAVGRKETTI